MDTPHASGTRHYDGFDLAAHLFAHQIRAALRGDRLAQTSELLRDPDWTLCAVFSGSQSSN